MHYRAGAVGIGPFLWVSAPRALEEIEGMDDENLEQLKDYAKGNDVGEDLFAWIGLSGRLTYLLSSPHEREVRERVLAVYRSSGLLGAQIEALSLLYSVIAKGRIEDLSDAESHQLLAEVDWSELFERHPFKVSSLSTEGSLVAFAVKYKFRIWDHLDGSVRRKLLSEALTKPEARRLLRYLGASSAEVDTALRDDSRGKQPGAEARVEVKDSNFIASVFAAYFSGSEVQESRGGVAGALRRRGFDLCDEYEGWGNAFEQIMASGTGPEEWPEELHRFVLCLSCNRFGEPNPSLTDEVVVRLVSGRDGKVDNTGVDRLLSPLKTAPQEAYSTDFATEISIVWLFELASAVTLLHMVPTERNEQDQRLSVLETLRGRKDPELRAFIETAQDAAKVLRLYPAMLDAIDNIGQRFNSSAATVDGRFRFVRSAYTLCGRRLSVLSDSMGSAVDISLASEVASGVAAGVAVRKLLEPDTLAQTLQRAYPSAEKIERAVEDFGEVDRLFAIWFDAMPTDFERLTAHLANMTRLLTLIRSRDTFEGLDDELALLQPGGSPFRVPQNVHLRFIVQAVLWLSRTDHPNPGMDDTSCCGFFTTTLFLAVVFWLDTHVDVVGLVPEWARERFLEYSRLAFGAVRAGASNKGPFSGLPNQKPTLRFLELLATIVDPVLYEKNLLQIALNPLLLAFRALGRPAVAPDLHIGPDKGSGSPSDEVTGHLSRLLHFMFRIPRRASQYVGDELREEFADFLVSRFKRRRDALETEEVAGWDPMSTEPHPAWRGAYLHALIDLRVNPGGKVHRLCTALAAHDPSDEVRRIALKGAETLSRERSTAADVSPKRAMLNAWWWIRKCHLEYLGVAIDEQAARITRTREVRV